MSSIATPKGCGSDVPIQSVGRALTLLTELQEGSELSLQEAADLLEVTTSTAHRLLRTLVIKGFAYQRGDFTYAAVRPLKSLCSQVLWSVRSSGR